MKHYSKVFLLAALCAAPALASAVTYNYRVPAKLVRSDGTGAGGAGAGGPPAYVPVASLLTDSSGGNLSGLIRTDSTFWVSGYNNSAFGNGTTANSSVYLKVADNVKAASAANHTVILKTDGTLLGTGWNSQYQLGTGNTTKPASFIQLLTNVRFASTSPYSTLAVRTDNTLWQAGMQYYRSPNSGIASYSYPTFTQIGSNVQMANAGTYHIARILADGTLQTLGECAGNITGFYTSDGTWQTAPFSNVIDVKVVRASLALTADGNVWSGGINQNGEFGDGTANAPTTYYCLPWRQVATGVRSIYMVQGPAGPTSFLVKTDNTLWASGNNEYGQMGVGNTTGASTFKQVFTDVGTVTGSFGLTMVRRTDGTIWVAGNNTYGAFGDGTTTSSLTWKKLIDP